MNSQLQTIGFEPLTIGSTKTFLYQGYLGGVPWNLAGGSGSLKMVDPNGVAYSYPVQIAGGDAFVVWTVLPPGGTWLRAWDVTDANGVRDVSPPIAFAVASSPS